MQRLVLQHVSRYLCIDWLDWWQPVPYLLEVWGTFFPDVVGHECQSCHFLVVRRPPMTDLLHELRHILEVSAMTLALALVLALVLTLPSASDLGPLGAEWT